MKIETYIMTTNTGKYIRKATMVTTDTGRVIKFTERLSKKEAEQQTLAQLAQIKLHGVYSISNRCPLDKVPTHADDLDDDKCSVCKHIFTPLDKYPCNKCNEGDSEYEPM